MGPKQIPQTVLAVAVVFLTAGVLGLRIAAAARAASFVGDALTGSLEPRDGSRAGSAAAAPLAPPPLNSTPDAVVFGHAANVYLQILAAGRLDGDGTDDLVVGELPTGTRGDERTESNLLLGRETWPPRSGSEGLAIRKIVEPVQDERDRFGFLGSGDLDGDGRDDLVTVTVRRPGEPGESVRLGLHWSPATWASRPNLSRPDVSIDVASNAVPDAAGAGDVDGDGAADLVLSGQGGVDIVRGRTPWPAAMDLEPPDVHIGPGPAAARLGDVTGDGCADVWLEFEAEGIDAALILGRSSWPPVVDAVADADIRLGSGSHAVGGAIVPDMSGDGLADVVRIDHTASSLEVYHGAADVVARLAARESDWSVTGISDTFAVDFLDLTGDGLAEILADRHAVIVGRAGRSGTIDLASGAYDADWPGLGAGPLWSLDVDGQRGDDVLVGDSGANVQGRRGAGTISIFLSPRFTPAPSTTPAPTTPAPATSPPATTSPTTEQPSATPTAFAPTATPVPSRTAGPSPTRAGTAEPGDPGQRVWLPVAWPGR